MKKLMILVALHALLLTSCDECDGIACATGPPSFTIELVDTETMENVFINGRYDEADMALSSADGQTASVALIAENNINTIRIELPSVAGDKELTLSIGNDVMIPISLYVRDGKTKCCTNYFAEDIYFSEFPFELINESGVFRVSI